VTDVVADRRGEVPSDAEPEVPAWVGTAAVVLLVGYIAVGRTFAQIGIPQLNLFLAEVALVGALAFPSARRTMRWWFSRLVAPGRLHGLVWLTALFLGYGVLLFLVAVVSGVGPIPAAKNLAFNFYVVFIPIGVWLGTQFPDLLQRLNRVLPYAMIAWIFGPFTLFGDAEIAIPFIAAGGVSVGSTGIAIIVMLAAERSVFDRWPLLAGMVVGLLYLQLRGEWLGLAVAVVVWAVVTKRTRILFAGAAALLLFFTTLAAAGIEIPGAGVRGGSTSITGIVGRAVAPFDEELAASLVGDEAETFAGTARWREEWWDGIWITIHADDTRTLFGYGYGYQLSLLSPLPAEELRTPHNIFFYALGFSGWVGVITFAALLMGLTRALWDVYRRYGNILGLLLVPLATATALFGNFFETPTGAVPFYVLAGICLAPAAGLARSDTTP
jgi:hypothetical protein